jgi:transcriptional regulator with XRE-family HTH domain
MVTAAQLRAARALLGIDQRRLAELSDLSVPTIQRMEASEGMIRGNVDSLMKLVGALDAAGIELIGDGATSPGGGRGARLKAASPKDASTGTQTYSSEARQMAASRARER